MAPQMDALSSFVFLTDNLPAWVVQINDLAVHTAKRHDEFAAEYTRLLKYVRPKKLKSPSLVSNRSNDKHSENRDSSSMTTTSQDREEINPLEAGNKYLFATVREKEKDAGASVRSGASGTRKFKQKHAVVIYYDSHVQTSLEAMVKNISTARNNLRKGKKTRDLIKGPMFAFSNFGSTIPNSKATSLVNTLDINPKAGNDIISSKPPADIDRCFELADKTLEQAQNLCEAAAHQFLRDGDTSHEFKTSKERLEQVIKIAEEAVKRLKEEEKAQEEEEEGDTTTDHATDFKFTFPPVTASKGYAPKADLTNTIEVDSDDGDSGGLKADFEDGFGIGRFRRNMRPNIARA